jgi:tRNA dimethylallyltransferase
LAVNAQDGGIKTRIDQSPLSQGLGLVFARQVNAPPIILIAGPTASGKSALALDLAQSLGGEIVNADAQQIYQALPLLSARPSAEDMARVPHHLFAVASPDQSWSVGHWLRACCEVLDEIRSRGRPSLIVGGTGLYFSALTRGLADIPPVPLSMRDAVEARLDQEGEAQFRDSLARIDPVAEARIAPGDRQRLIRALAVAEATGQALSQWQSNTQPALKREDWRGLVIEPDRKRLYQGCDARLLAMLEAGVLGEVAEMMAMNLNPTLPALKAVGYRELASHLAGETPLDHALDQAQMQTRRYAKRQLTWFRNQTPDWARLTSSAADQAERLIFAPTGRLTPAP